MNVRFPDGFYGDIRIEDVFETMLQVTLSNWEQIKERAYKAAFIRLYDGKRWYYASTTDVDALQSEIDSLAAMGTPNAAIADDPIVRLYETNTGNHQSFTGEDDVRSVSLADKRGLLESYIPLVDGKPYVELWRANYIDQHVVKTFVSSKGADFTHDYQRTGFRIFFKLSHGEEKFGEMYDQAANYFRDLGGLSARIEERYKKAVEYLLNAKNIEPGSYPVILSPAAAGVFAHESFGHKSESDFMIGDEAMRKEWELGKKVGASILSIIEDGRKDGVGRIPFDDEGTAARENYLIKDGVLSGRLHSAVTAASLGEGLTGNARAINFEFEPIVRMTTTYIGAGTNTLDELIAGVDKGVLVETISHGSGMSTFTMAPRLAYMIRDGKLAEPVKASVVSGSVFETLGEIDGLSDKVEMLSFALGGCGKMEQMPLPVGFGGPWVRVKKLDVR